MNEDNSFKSKIDLMLSSGDGGSIHQKKSHDHQVDAHLSKQIQTLQQGLSQAKSQLAEVMKQKEELAVESR